MSDNLYAPPQAELDGTARREPSDDDGDLDKAMTGASRLQAFEVLRKAADWLDGMKLTTLAIFILVSSAYGAVMVGLFLLFGARVGLGLEDFGVPGVFEHKMAQLSADPSTSWARRCWRRPSTPGCTWCSGTSG
ncbi:MAG: hypothetical protein H6741_25870 [Alphaproteobacteria bacterium]|nr:hypothetical protein [Alphaproteobacteria bacterium]